MPVEILFEDNHLICVSKPAGQLTQGDRSGSVSLLDSVKEHIKIRDSKPGKVYLGMVQRLDKPVSGVIVFAKTSKAASRLSEGIRNHEVTKLYLAVTEVRSQEAVELESWLELRHYLQRIKDRTVVCSAGTEHARYGVLQMRSLVANDRYGCHLIRLITGRKHQIRAQLAHVGLPICGDLKYGSRKQHWAEGIALHAIRLEFTHPVRHEPVSMVSQPPPLFLSCFSEQEISAIRKEIGDGPRFS